VRTDSFSKLKLALVHAASGQPRHILPLPAHGPLRCGRSGSSTALAAAQPPRRCHPLSADSLDRGCAVSAWVPCSAADHRDLHSNRKHVALGMLHHEQHPTGRSTIKGTCTTSMPLDGFWWCTTAFAACAAFEAGKFWQLRRSGELCGQQCEHIAVVLAGLPLRQRRIRDTRVAQLLCPSDISVWTPMQHEASISDRRNTGTPCTHRRSASARWRMPVWDPPCQLRHLHHSPRRTAAQLLSAPGQQQHSSCLLGCEPHRLT
jgi:hypothetical protein